MRDSDRGGDDVARIAATQFVHEMRLLRDGIASFEAYLFCRREAERTTFSKPGERHVPGRAGEADLALASPWCCDTPVIR